MCDAAIRPFTDDTELRCEQNGEHDMHMGTARDMAYPGSSTTITWHEGDRRNFHGDWPGVCSVICMLPSGHKGNHAG